jgi:chemotaxis response regulator CheB
VVEAGGRAFGLVADAVTDVHPLQGPVEPLEVTPAQDEASCVVAGMPGAAVAAGAVDQVVPVGELAARIAAAWSPAC